MKTFAHIICAVILASTLTAQAKSLYAGSTYEVEIVRSNGKVDTGVCITFDQSGRFTKSDEALSMLWAARDQFPNQFMAVTAPGERTVVPYHMGVYGTAFPDKSLTGRGIDQYGNSFVFHGKVNSHCGDHFPERTAGNSIQAIFEFAKDTGKPPGNVIPIINPCWLPNGSQAPCDPVPVPILFRAGASQAQELSQTSNPCSQWHCDPIPNPLGIVNLRAQQQLQIVDPCSYSFCDPIPNPLGAVSSRSQKQKQLDDPCSQSFCDPVPDPLVTGTEHVSISNLAGRSFRLTLGSSDQSVLEYCWRFGEKRDIQTDQNEVLRWSTVIGAYNAVGFQSVGAGSNGRGMAYHGTLVGYDLLEVVGIEALNGKSVTTYGYGQEVSSCKKT